MPFTSADITFTPSARIGTTSTLEIADRVDWLATYGINPADASITYTYVQPDTISRSFPSITGGNTTATNSYPLATDGSPQKGNFAITATVVVTGAVDPGTYVRTVNIDICPEVIVPAFKWTLNCNGAAPVVSVIEATAYPTSATKVYSKSLVPPPISGTATYTNAALSIDTGNDRVYKGEWTLNSTTTAILVKTNHQIVYTVTGASTRQVICDSVCDLNCYVRSAWDAIDFCSSTADEKLEVWLQAAVIAAQAQVELNECYSPDRYDDYVTRLKKVVGGDNCGCADGDTSNWITPISSAGSITISSTSLVVSVSGTDFTINLTTAQQGILANVFNTVVASADGSIAIGPAVITPGNPPKHSFDLSVSSGVRGRLGLEYMFDVVISGGVVAFNNISQRDVKGDRYTGAPGITQAAYPNAASVGTDPAILEISDFVLTTPSTLRWKATTSVVYRNFVPAIASWYNGVYGNAESIPELIRPYVIQCDWGQGKFWIGFRSDTVSNPYQLIQWSTIESIAPSFRIAIKISE